LKKKIRLIKDSTEYI